MAARQLVFNGKYLVSSHQQAQPPYRLFTHGVNSRLPSDKLKVRMASVNKRQPELPSSCAARKEADLASKRTS